MVNLISNISEEITRVEYEQQAIITHKLRKKNRVKTLAGTLEIEGIFLGEEKITAMLEGKRVLGTYAEILEVEGAINAYKEFENYDYDKLDDLKTAHKILMNDILKTAGNFRTVNVGVGSVDGVSHVAPPHGMVSSLMYELFDWLKNSDEHPLIKSCVFHYEFEFIHPFSDGNGRIGRLWQSVILYAWREVFSAMPTESIVRDNQEKYYKALEDAGSVGESTPFIEFMLEVILTTVQSSVKSDQESNLKRDKKVLLLMLENSEITIKEICSKINMSESGVKKVIKKLKDENKIERLGSLKAGHWKVINEN
jgi:Fic family protein